MSDQISLFYFLWFKFLSFFCVKGSGALDKQTKLAIHTYTNNIHIYLSVFLPPSLSVAKKKNSDFPSFVGLRLNEELKSVCFRSALFENSG